MWRHRLDGRDVLRFRHVQGLELLLLTVFVNAWGLFAKQHCMVSSTCLKKMYINLASHLWIQVLFWAVANFAYAGLSR